MSEIVLRWRHRPDEDQKSIAAQGVMVGFDSGYQQGAAAMLDLLADATKAIVAKSPGLSPTTAFAAALGQLVGARDTLAASVTVKEIVRDAGGRVTKIVETSVPRARP